MIIVIEELLDAMSGQVRFRCGSRSAKGYWRGTGEAPVGVGLDVEIELSEEEIISSSPASRSSRDPVRQEGDAIVLMGRVESVDADGIIVFRVGSGIVLLEPSGPLAGLVAGTDLELRVPNLRIFPIGIV